MVVSQRVRLVRPSPRRPLCIKSRLLRGVLAIVVGVALVACTSAGGATPTSTRPPASAASSPSVTTPTSTETTSTIDPRARPAVDVLLRLQAAAVEAFLHPYDITETPPKGADFFNFAFDPLRGELTASVASLKRGNLVFGGPAPVPRIRVQSIEPAATPYPRIILTNCPDQDPKWRVYHKDSGKPAPALASSVPPPYLATFVVIRIDGKWGVSKSTVDDSKTCTP